MANRVSALRGAAWQRTLHARVILQSASNALRRADKRPPALPITTAESRLFRARCQRALSAFSLPLRHSWPCRTLVGGWPGGMLLTSLVGLGGLCSCGVGGLLALLGLHKGHEARRLGAALPVDNLSGAREGNKRAAPPPPPPPPPPSAARRLRPHAAHPQHPLLVPCRPQTAVLSGASVDSGDGARDGAAPVPQRVQRHRRGNCRGGLAVPSIACSSALVACGVAVVAQSRRRSCERGGLAGHRAARCLQSSHTSTLVLALRLSSSLVPLPACTIEQVRKEKVFEKRTSNFDAWVTYGELQVRCAALRWLPLRLVVACAVRCGAACCAALCAPLLVQGLACSKAPPPPPVTTCTMCRARACASASGRWATAAAWSCRWWRGATPAATTSKSRGTGCECAGAGTACCSGNQRARLRRKACCGPALAGSMLAGARFLPAFLSVSPLLLPHLTSLPPLRIPSPIPSSPLPPDIRSSAMSSCVLLKRCWAAAQWGCVRWSA